MNIHSLFNETELDIFSRKTGFTFGDCIQCAEGIIFAIDDQSGQVFAGNDLLRSSVHDLGDLLSVRQDEDQAVHLIFKDSSEVRLMAGEEDAAVIMADLLSRTGVEDTAEPAGIEEPEPQEDEGYPFLGNDDLNEVYSRLANTGRSSAIHYLVSEVGMSVNDARDYVDSLQTQDELVESVPDTDFRADGTMTKRAILAVVKELGPGDRIHLEYKPLLGRKRILDAEYVKVGVDVTSKYFSLTVYEHDYKSLIDSIADDLFSYMELHFFNEARNSESSCNFHRITLLQKL